jgi:hypothetical protein
MTPTLTEHHSPTQTLDDRCSHCGAELQDDQEWCLECGASRTLIHRPPDWRIPLAIIGGTVAVAVLVFVLVLSNAGGSGRMDVATAAATVVTHNSPAPGAVPGWPQGLGGWTVALSKSRNRATAFTRARRIAANGVQVGVLDSSLHPVLHPGRWIVFSGRYPTKSGAKAAAAQLISLGHAHAHALLVGRPA